MKKSPDNGSLLVFRIIPDGNWECYYNGNTDRVWRSLEAKNATNGEKEIKLDALRKLDQDVGTEERVPLRIGAV